MVANRLAVLTSIADAEAQPAKGASGVPSASNESIVESVPSASNESIVESTGLDPETVASVLRELWHSHEIEGILTRRRASAPHGDRRVLPGRPRAWANDGWYVEQPG